ncbi:MAG: MFS transporter [Geminicoccaceae bacterium]|nr:MFS transporter [Geminicoccaceae bacterium]
MAFESASTLTHGPNFGLGRDGQVIGTIGVAHGGSHFFQLVLPSLFPWLIDAFAVSATRLGLLLAVFFAVSGVAQAFAGILVDRFGGGRVLTVGLALLGVGALIAALAPTFAFLLPAVVLMGLGNSVFHPADYAILSHHVSPGRLGRAYGIHTVGGSVGWALAPIAMAGIAGVAGWRTALVVAALIGFGLSFFVAAGRARLETPLLAAVPGKSRGSATIDYLRLVSHPSILMCFAFFIFVSLVLLGLQTFMPLGFERLRGMDALAAGAAVTALMLGSAAGTLVGGHLADRGVRLQAIIGVGLVLAAGLVWLLGLPFLPAWGIYALAAGAGALLGMTTPSRDLLVRRAAPPGATGRVFGFVYSGLDLGATLAPVLMGALLDHGHGDRIFTVIAGFVLCSLVCAMLVGPGRESSA